MSKNITIQEGGTGKQLTVDKLKTKLVGGGTCLWVPQDEVLLGRRTISQNGTYVAADDGLYGYARVTVSGIGKVCGKASRGMPSADGNEYYVSTTSGDDLAFTKIPSSIRVTTPPTVTEYIDGHAIDYSGMVVTAYDANGQSMGTIPANELVLPVETADYDDAAHTNQVTTDFDIQPNPFDMGDLTRYEAWSVGHGAYRRSKTSFGMEGARTTIRNNGFSYSIIASDAPFSAHYILAVYYCEASEIAGMTLEEIARSDLGSFLYFNESDLHNDDSYTYNGKTVYYHAGSYNGLGYSNINYVTSGALDQIAWAMVYGEITGSGTLKVPVMWNRTGDGRLLETGFDIIVTPREFGGGQTSGGGAGRND